MLVPTTVLAQQHFETFSQRLAAYPVKVEMLSRFRTPREQTEILNKLALGSQSQADWLAYLQEQIAAKELLMASGSVQADHVKCEHDYRQGDGT